MSAGTSKSAGAIEPLRLSSTPIPTLVFESPEQVAAHVAGRIAALIRARAAAGRPCVLGLATGSTPLGVYRELVRLHRDAELDLRHVIVFMLDEYYPMTADQPQSYRRFMQRVLLDHVNIPSDQFHIPDGALAAERVRSHCKSYEEQIAAAGGIDLQLLGIGRSGHIGFNEPGSRRDSRTRLVTLDLTTRRDAAHDFYGEENVPHQAVTMGVGTILESREVVVVALGGHKAAMVRRMLEEDPTPHVPASYLQEHPQVHCVLDAAAAGALAEVREPWRSRPVEWTDEAIRRALVPATLATGKSLLKLQDSDLAAHGLHDLVRRSGPASKLGDRVFRQLSEMVRYVPGDAGDRRPVLVMSPHPDDDCISMGGTILHLAQERSEVHIAYMTSGNIAVFDHDVRRHSDFVTEYLAAFQLDTEASRRVADRIGAALAAKRPGAPDSAEVLKVKELIRATEARAAALALGVPVDRTHFLNLPFYATGQIEKKPLGDDDVAIVVELLRRVRPGQLYVAGEMSDPHGTHRVCADAVYRAVAAVAPEGITPEIWLYCGAWEEWDPAVIECMVPLTPDELRRKREAIFMHESQKDHAMFPGPSDDREFWQRVEDRNKHTAEIFNRLGLPEYFALEGFVRWKSPR